MRLRTAFYRGMLGSAPFILIVAPFSMLFGVVARDAGLDVLQVMTMSIIVIAGAAQFTAITLLQDQAPVFVVLLASLTVNLRMAMYSAALVPHIGHAPLKLRILASYLMVDQAFAVAVKTYTENPEMQPDEKLSFYFGCMVLICPFWYVFTFLGAAIGNVVPPELSLDYALPICFISLLAPLMTSWPNIIAAIVSIITSILFAWLPWSLGLIVAAFVAMVVGAQAELYLKRREANEVKP